MIDSTEFLPWLYQRCEVGNINFRFLSGQETRDQFLPLAALCDNPKQVSTLLQSKQEFNSYFGVALRENGNGKKDGITEIPAVWIDLDGSPLDPITDSPWRPSAAVETSPGRFHVYFKLKEPAVRSEIPAVENILKRLAAQFKGDRQATDASRILRLPGTPNHKLSPPFIITIKSISESEYNLSDFDALPEIDDQAGPASVRRDTDRIKKILSCKFLEHCDKDRTALSEPEWYAMISILAREQGGRDLIHSLSHGYPKYSRSETDQKILHALNAGPTTCQRVRELWECKERCGVNSPATLAFRGDASGWIDDADPYARPQKEGQRNQIKELSYSSLNLPSSLEISRMEVKVHWVVKNLIPKDGITNFHSIGGVGKTYLMYGIAKAVADGSPFFGLDVMRMNVYYIDFENPLPEIVERMKKMGGSENLKIWHLGHDPMPIRFDAEEWEIYKKFPPGLFIIDSLRSSHLLEENSSKDASFIMARHKEIRALGNTIILIHHENKIGGYRGSTAWFDLADHILKFSRVKRIGSDEDTDEEDLTLPIRLGLGGKSRFSSAMELKPMYFKFENHQLCCADDPEEEVLNKMGDLLDPVNPPNQSEFRKLAKENLDLKRKAFDKLLRKGGERNLWYSRRSRDRNKLIYLRGENGEF